ncbi:MAG: glutathione S-transferase N-terminal domain-containing protein [Henriciella sp.]|nr:glutathione S-transferase N-terminal domain-containing protein [Henriciella sp.]
MIDFYTAATPNGHKVAVTLEELGLDSQPVFVDLANQEQKSDEFLAINPNGRIPTIIDRDRDDFSVFESGAIMIYLAEKCGQLLPTDVEGRSRVMQWLMFQRAGVGPMMGQAYYFMTSFEPQRPDVIERFRVESMRLLEVLDHQLENEDYLAGDYSIADIANWCWANAFPRDAIQAAELVALERWLDRIAARGAVQRGLAVKADAELSEA